MSEFETIVNMYSSGRSVLQICDSLYGNSRIGLTKVYSTLKASGLYSKYKIYKYKTCNMFCYKLSSKSKVLEFLGAIYSDSDIHLDRKFECYRAHVKPGELLEAALEGNQQLEHSSSSESIERQGLQ